MLKYDFNCIPQDEEKGDDKTYFGYGAQNNFICQRAYAKGCMSVLVYPSRRIGEQLCNQEIILEWENVGSHQMYAISQGLQVRSKAISVSYTHLTLPTIYSV